VQQRISHSAPGSDKHEDGPRAVLVKYVIQMVEELAIRLVLPFLKVTSKQNACSF
jgi:hypothetical protein